MNMGVEKVTPDGEAERGLVRRVNLCLTPIFWVIAVVGLRSSPYKTRYTLEQRLKHVCKVDTGGCGEHGAARTLR